MTIEFEQKTFGANNKAAAAVAKPQKPAAKYWLNVGYQVEYPLEDGNTETRLVSLPIGIPVDTQEAIKLPNKPGDYADFVGARNDLLAQVMAAAEQLQPGESRVLKLVVELRRVGEEAVATPADKNKFAIQNVL